MNNLKIKKKKGSSKSKFKSTEKVEKAKKLQEDEGVSKYHFVRLSPKEKIKKDIHSKLLIILTL